jgi:hypothetical protein
VASFVGRHFWVNNPFDRTVEVRLEVAMPAFLREKQWQLTFASAGGAKFSLGARADREVTMRLREGLDFTPTEVEQLGKEAVIEVHAYVDGILTGGMTYQLDPRMKEPAKEHPVTADPTPGGACGATAKGLLSCVDLGSLDVKKVRVRKVTVDIEMKDDCDC